MKLVGFGNREPEVASTLAGRLARLDAQLPGEEREMLAKLAGGVYLGAIARGIVEALDPDTQLEAVNRAGGDDADEEAVAQVASGMIAEALKPLLSNPELHTPSSTPVGRSSRYRRAVPGHGACRRTL